MCFIRICKWIAGSLENKLIRKGTRKNTVDSAGRGMLGDNEASLKTICAFCFSFPVLLSNKYIVTTQTKKSDLILDKIAILK